MLLFKIGLFYFKIYTSESNLFLWWKAEFFSTITPVYSITRSFRNHFNIQYWFAAQEIINVKDSYAAHLIVETLMHFFFQDYLIITFINECTVIFH